MFLIAYGVTQDRGGMVLFFCLLYVQYKNISVCGSSGGEVT